MFHFHPVQNEAFKWTIINVLAVSLLLYTFLFIKDINTHFMLFCKCLLYCRNSQLCTHASDAPLCIMGSASRLFTALGD